MKTKTKRGKAILGLAVVAIMLASVFAALAPTSTAVSKGDDYNYIGKTTTLQDVLVGQNIQFNETGTPNAFADKPTVYRYVSGDLEDYWTADSDWRIYNVNWPTTGAYYVSDNASDKKGQAQISVKDPKMPLKLKVGTKVVSSVAVGSKGFKVDIDGINLFNNDKVDLVVIGPTGQIKNDTANPPYYQQFTDITVSKLKNTYGKQLNTTGWDIGVYTFKVKTKDDKACGLIAESDVKELKLLKGAIAIEADTTNTVELNTVTLTVTGVAEDTIKVEAIPCEDASFKEGIDDTPSDAGCSFTQNIDSDGVRKYAIEFTDTGSFTIKVTVIGSPGDVRNGDYDTVDIAVTEKEVEFDLPSTVVIGDRITIKGTSASGTYVSVYVEDTLYPQLKALVIDDGEFEKEITTTEIGMNVPGSVRLKAWIDITPAPATPPTTTADGEDAILLTTPDLTAELSASAVAIGDSFHVTGVAKGATTVTILTVPPKGGGGKALTADRKGITKLDASVSTTDHTFDRKLSVQDDAASGYYDIYVLSPGMDGLWDATINKSIVYAIEERYNFNITNPSSAGTKSQDNIFSVLVDLTTTAASDDLMWVAQIKAEEPRVTLNPIAAVGVGQPLVVSGLCNRADGYTIVVTAKGMFGELDPQTVNVHNGTFNATLDTTGAVEGPYLVKADDGDGHTDEATVTIGEAVPTPTPTAEPTEPTPAAEPTEPTPTAEPTAAPEPTPEPTAEPPGFEAIFAIAGLLAVAYLVIRRRK